MVEVGHFPSRWTAADLPSKLTTITSPVSPLSVRTRSPVVKATEGGPSFDPILVTVAYAEFDAGRAGLSVPDHPYLPVGVRSSIIAVW